MYIRIPRIPPSPNERKWRHPQAYKRLRTMWEQELLLALTPVERSILKAHAKVSKMYVAITQYRSRVMDADNLTASIKVILDALQNVEYLHKDNSEWLALASVTQYPSSRKDAKTVIMIEPVLPDHV